MDPSDGWSTTSAFPIRRWPGTVLGFIASPTDLVCWNVLCESGNMTRQSESSLANDGRDCQETGLTSESASELVTKSSISDSLIHIKVWIEILLGLCM